MHRLFIAIRPPATIRSQLLAQMAGVPGARWQDDSQLHLTLRFIGEVDRHQAGDIADALAGVRFTPFDIALAGAGYFDRRGVVDTLWAGVQPRDPLAHLHAKVDRACVSAGIAPETRAYLPHITVARFSRHGGDIAPFLALHASFASPAFTVNQFSLYESRLGHAGSSYHAVETYRADGNAGTRDD
ncbi:RNA 2',3'-cyclic phosphodiesterase [Sphingobium sp. WTD-1]|jgi:2'-5' RNA ligase|uniref:RNA 2',3'-cyclic phosphodiesterase n=1 Tax=Sphingobium sp. WTD-1 TaxID=2979467 RepID=UPI0024DEDF95|nr:RNA 2',3'-cyclic phosphodiesterase [Sphingobium sp. WTD-1]WIA58343.1 RNA 2',3'-cyclic phosphodiesterase [Sphingobium sp. WTD-1]